MCLGVLSNTRSAHLSLGVFVQFVLGAMAAFAGVLTAYALRWIRVAHRWYGFFCAAAGVLLLNVADILLFLFLGADGLGYHHVAVGVLRGVMGIAPATPFHEDRAPGAVRSCREGAVTLAERVG
ncbi:Bax inhibitor-1/YccA family membrane protein [Streptomyces sp. NPDC005122]